MNRAGFKAVAFALLLAVAGPTRLARAADPAVMSEIEAQNKAFSAAYEDGDVAKMKAAVKKAVAAGEKGGLAADAAMVDTYVLAAILEADGNENKAASVRYFVKALKLKADLTIPKGMGTSTVKAALKQARAESGGGEAPKEAAAPKTETKAEPVAETEAAKPAKEAAKDDKAAQKEQARQDKERAAEQARADAEAKQREKQQEKQDKQAKQDREASEKALAEAKSRAQQAEKDKSDRDRQLADSKGRAQQLEQQLQKDKADRDKQLADARAHAAQLEKDRAERDKQLTDAKARIQQLEQQLQKDKSERDKQVADAKARIQQLEQQLQKEKGDRDRQLADAKAREDKEREAREKIERERLAAETKAREADNKKKQDQQNRERLFAGPDLPARIGEPLLCAVPDEAPLRTDLFVHCVARPNVKARSIVFYYRVAGSAQYYSMPMERTSKGWFAALVPGVRVVGKVMQYYAEALDSREAVVAHNGKESSPNILTLKSGAPRG
jgi:hypothetical protein